MGVTTPTAKRLVAAPGKHLWMNWPDDLIAIEQEAAAMERERLSHKLEKWRRDGWVTTNVALRLLEGGFWDDLEARSDDR